MLKVFKKISALLSPDERRRAGVLFALMLSAALVEVFGVASIMPFVALLSKPEVVETNRYLAAVYAFFGFSDTTQFLTVVGIVVFTLFLTSLALKALTAYAILRFTSMRAHAFAYRLLEGYLGSPYHFFLGRNTAELSKTLFSEVGEVINGVLLPVLRLCSGGIVALLMIALLFSVEPVLTPIVGLAIGGSFVTLYLLTRRYLQRIGELCVRENRARFVAANEALGGIKELRLMGREPTFLKRFSQASEQFAVHQAISKATGDLPHFAIQAIAFGGVLGLLIYLSMASNSLQDALPLIALYAFAGYRLLPAFQEIFKNSTQLRFYGAALENLHRDLTSTAQHAAARRELSTTDTSRLNGDIVLHALSYAFPGSESNTLNEISLTIPQGSCVGFVGTTGAGKSTTVDLILGLLEPGAGRITVAGQPLEGETLRAWQRNIGYVPQSIYLSDASIAENIAFGIAPEEIDLAAVESAARAAHIHDFVVDQLPEGYQTAVGERGIRLSGGQRQRLGIARALYHDPAVIVFDEATSALDNATEAAVMEAVNELTGSKTIIMIAHRLSTVERCDRIFLLSRGRLAAQGSYRELLASSSEFADMVRISHTEASNAGSPSPSNPQPLEAS